MSFRELLETYQNSPRLFQLADRLSFAQKQKIYLKNLFNIFSSPPWPLLAAAVCGSVSFVSASFPSGPSGGIARNELKPGMNFFCRPSLVSPK
jgi:hypothetical protein